MCPSVSGDVFWLLCIITCKLAVSQESSYHGTVRAWLTGSAFSLIYLEISPSSWPWEDGSQTRSSDNYIQKDANKRQRKLQFDFRERKRKRRLFQRQPETNSQYCQVLSGAYSGMLISGTFMFLAVNSKTLHLTCWCSWLRWWECGSLCQHPVTPGAHDGSWPPRRIRRREK